MTTTSWTWNFVDSCFLKLFHWQWCIFCFCIFLECFDLSVCFVILSYISPADIVLRGGRLGNISWQGHENEIFFLYLFLLFTCPHGLFFYSATTIPSFRVTVSHCAIKYGVSWVFKCVPNTILHSKISRFNFDWAETFEIRAFSIHLIGIS